MNKQVLDVVNAVSFELEVDKEVIFGAIENALETVTLKQRYLNKKINIKVTIDRKTGNYATYRCWEIVDEDYDLYDPDINIKKNDISIQLQNQITDNLIKEEIESIKFGRIAAQIAKQKILNKVYQAKQQKLVVEYTKKINTLISSTVKKITRDEIIFDLNDGSGSIDVVVKKSDMLSNEPIHIGNRMKVLLIDIISDGHSPKIIGTRASKKILIELFKTEIPEIGEDIIEIKSVAREPGYRSKIAVKTNDGRIDPIGACIGMRGSRIQAISNELNNEKIDIILWNDDPAQLVINAMAPADVASIIVDEDEKSIDIAVDKEQLPQAIGKNGQNIRLASELTGWILNVMSIEDFEEKGNIEIEKTKKIFIDNLEINNDLADLLVNEGFMTIEEIAYVPLSEFQQIEGLTEEIIEEIKIKAKKIIEKEKKKNEPSDDLISLEGMTTEIATKLSKNNILTRENLAELSIDDITDIIPEINRDKAGELIMKARQHWFK